MIILKDSFQKSNALKTCRKDTTNFQESKQNKQKISISKPNFLRLRCISKPKTSYTDAFPNQNFSDYDVFPKQKYKK